MTMEKRIILLADDDRDDIEMFCEALEDIQENITCHCTANGREALNKMDEVKEQPHIIFLDVNMPVMNGWQCLEVLKGDQRYRHIPVIMISTSSHQREIDRASELGALCYMTKPSSFEELKQILKVIITNLGTGLKDSILQMQMNGSRYVNTFPGNI